MTCNIICKLRDKVYFKYKLKLLGKVVENLVFEKSLSTLSIDILEIKIYKRIHDPVFQQKRGINKNQI